MPKGRPKLPTEQKKLSGTYRAYRENKNPSADVLISQTSVIVSDNKKFPCPRCIKDAQVKKFWEQTIKNLKTLKVLAENDIPQIEMMCIMLQKINQLKTVYMKLDPITDGEDYERVDKALNRASNKFDTLASKFYISPAARTQLRLNDLNLVKTAQEVSSKQKDAIDQMLSGEMK